MKKILFISPYDIHSQKINFISNYYNVKVLSLKKRKGLNPKLEKIVKHKKILNLPNIMQPQFILNLKNEITNFKPDIIVVYEIYQGFFYQILFSNLDKNIKIVNYTEFKTFTKNPLKAIYLYLSKLIINWKKIDLLISPSKAGEIFLKKEFKKIPIQRIEVPVDTNMFKPTKKKKTLENNTLKILMNARFVKYKRHELLIKALKYIETKEPQFKYELNLLGEGPEKEKIKKLISKQELNNKVNFLNKVPLNKVKNYYNESDLLILPSYNEAIGMTIPEAMACEIPTISSSTVGGNTYIKDSKTGLTFKDNNYIDLAKKIIKISNKELIIKYGKAGRKEIIKNYNSKKINLKFKKIIDNLINNF